MECQKGLGGYTHLLASCRQLADRTRRSACQGADPCAFPAACHCAEKRAKQGPTAHKLSRPAIYSDTVFLLSVPRHIVCRDAVSFSIYDYGVEIQG